jgi:hypothetical protein
MDEKALIKALTGIQVLTASVPGPNYLAQLNHSVLRAQEALRTLNHAVNR